MSGFPKHEGGEAIPHETTRACAYLSKGRMGGRLLTASIRGDDFFFFLKCPYAHTTACKEKTISFSFSLQGSETTWAE